MGEALFPYGATYLLPIWNSSCHSRTIKAEFQQFLGQPFFTWTLFWADLPKISKGFSYRKGQSSKLPCGAVDVKLLVTSPTVNAASGKMFVSTGIPQIAPDDEMQMLSNVGHHLQNRSKQPGICICWQMDIRVLISNMCIWWSTWKVT